METPATGGVVADAAALATAAEDIRALVRWAPELVLWVPGRAVWGLALFAGREQTLVSIDGCLTVAMTVWPDHYLPGAAYHLDAIVRLLSAHWRLNRAGAAALVTAHLPQAVSGSCCVAGVHADLPWLQGDAVLLPLTAPPVWTAPADPWALEPPRAIHPLLTIIGQRPACADAATFCTLIGEAPDAVLLPRPARSTQLRTWWRMHADLERERLRLTEQEVPIWLQGDAAWAALATAWCDGWRAGPLPASAAGPAPALVVAAAVPPPVAAVRPLTYGGAVGNGAGGALAAEADSGGDAWM